MAECAHDLIEWQSQDEQMHCLGWACQGCGHQVMGECHHQSWCRGDFCGAEPVFEPTPKLGGARA